MLHELNFKLDVMTNEEGNKNLEENVRVKRGRIDNIIGDQALVVDYEDNNKHKLVLVKWLKNVQ